MIIQKKNSVILIVHVQPKASKTEFVGIHGDDLKFRVTASPIKRAANTELCRYLAKLFAIPAQAVSICSGLASRKKKIELIGMTEEKVRRVLNLLK